MSGYRAKDPTKWRLEEQEDGSFDIYQGRRRRKAGAEPVDAMRFVRREMEPHHKVVHVEPDGYETNVTKQYFGR